MIQGLAVTLGWRPRRWGMSRLSRTKLGISHWPLLQGRNLEPLAAMETDHLPIAKQPESSLAGLSPLGMGQAGLSGQGKDSYEHRHLCPLALCGHPVSRK